MMDEKDERWNDDGDIKTDGCLLSSRGHELMFRCIALLLCLFLYCCTGYSFTLQRRITLRQSRIEMDNKDDLSTSTQGIEDATIPLLQKPEKENENEKSEDSSDWINSAILVAGTTVGAGVLALPEVAAPSGIIPSVIALIITWGFMASTGLLYSEVASNLRRSEGAGMSFGVLSMIDKTLGRPVGAVAGAFYLFIHYTILTAYISEAGNVINDTLSVQEIGAPLFALSSGAVLLFGSEAILENINGLSLGIILASFFALALIGGRLFDLEYALSTQNYSVVTSALPIMLLALVYHNVVPVITQQLNYDKSKIEKAIIIGTAVPLFMFIVWIVVILGIKPDLTSIVVGDGRLDPVAVLRDTSSNPFIPPLVQTFSLFAISTSFTGFVLGLDNFFRDLFPSRKSQDFGLYALCIVPPLLISTTGASDMFIELLDSAGSYGITVLFGAIPAIMAFKMRSDAAENNADYVEYVDGGNPVLLGIFASAVFVLVQKIISTSSV